MEKGIRKRSGVRHRSGGILAVKRNDANNFGRTGRARSEEAGDIRENQQEREGG